MGTIRSIAAKLAYLMALILAIVTMIACLPLMAAAAVIGMLVIFGEWAEERGSW